MFFVNHLVYGIPLVDMFLMILETPQIFPMRSLILSKSQIASEHGNINILEESVDSISGVKIEMSQRWSTCLNFIAMLD